MKKMEWIMPVKSVLSKLTSNLRLRPLLVIALFVVVGYTGTLLSAGQEDNQQSQTRKILVLVLFEQNWDNIPMSFGKHRRSSPPTRKRIIGSAEGKRKTYLPDTGEGLLNFHKHLISSNTIVYVYYYAEFLANTDVLEDDQFIDWDIGRRGTGVYYYPIEELPYIIPLDDPLKYRPSQKGVYYKNFKYVKILKKMKLIQYDNNGNVQLNYLGKNIQCDAGDKIEFPLAEKLFPLSEFAYNDPFSSDKNGKNHKRGYARHKNLAIENLKKGQNKKTYLKKDMKAYVRTKLTLINYGFIEFQE